MPLSFRDVPELVDLDALAAWSRRRPDERANGVEIVQAPKLQS